MWFMVNLANLKIMGSSLVKICDWSHVTKTCQSCRLPTVLCRNLIGLRLVNAELQFQENFPISFVSDLRDGLCSNTVTEFIGEQAGEELSILILGINSNLNLN